MEYRIGRSTYNFGTRAVSQSTIATFDGLAIIVMDFVVRSEWPLIDTAQKSRSNSREALLGIVHIFFTYRQRLHQHLGGPLKIFQRYLRVIFKDKARRNIKLIAEHRSNFSN